MVARILVVEDEPAILESVAYALEREGFLVDQAGTLSVAEQCVDRADLVLLDLMLPDGSGFTLISSLRRASKLTPIIVLSSRDAEADRVTALEAGADDYVTKPFSPREVVARVRAVLRRVVLAGAPPGDVGPLVVDVETRRAKVLGRMLDLTRVEFDVLACLLRAQGKVYTREQLIDEVWGDGFAITDRTIDSHVKSLRRKLGEAGAHPGLIETVRGVGYRVTFEPSAVSPAP
ncbi:MAG: response regulator transcription factor [Polyangiaceae bacterium]|nr:response regulator transcription factor [Polyangiaceae bacterium]